MGIEYIDIVMRNKERTDSIDSRSYSFDSTENEKTKPIKIKKKIYRKRDQALVQIQPSPSTDKLHYLLIFQNK